MAALIYAVVAVLSFVVQPALLYLAARIVRVSGITLGRAFVASLFLTVLGAVVFLAQLLTSEAPAAVWVALAIGLAGLLFAIFLVRERLRTTFWRAAGCYGLTAVASVLLALGVRAVAVEAFCVSGGSMAPAVLAGDRVLIDKITLHLRPPRRGEVVVFRGPAATADDPAVQKHFPGTAVAIKRVAAVEGDRVDMINNGFYVNGVKVAIPLSRATWREYSPFMPAYPLVVPPGKVFLLGDNSPRSLDGRVWGLTDLKSLIGLAGVIYASRALPDPDSSSLPPSSPAPPPGPIRWSRIGSIIH
ncbi:MAG: signal peptidase I [Planctomycetota bacterium]|nr:signal peptidase I [Planctomycetota bacterium]